MATTDLVIPVTLHCEVRFLVNRITEAEIPGIDGEVTYRSAAPFADTYSRRRSRCWGWRLWRWLIRRRGTWA